jgi:predicted nucleotidyltransferase
MQSRFGLCEEVIDKIKSVIKKYPQVQRCIVYGSRAKGNFKPGSDIDLTLEAPGMSFSELLKLESEIDDLLLPYKVDLSLKHQIDNQELLEHIERVGQEF